MGHNYHYHDGTDEYVTEFLVRKADLEFDLQQLDPYTRLPCRGMYNDVWDITAGDLLSAVINGTMLGMSLIVQSLELDPPFLN